MILDTGVIFSALDRSEPHHEACASLLLESEDPLIIPAPVLVEVDFLVANRMRTNRSFLNLLQDIEIGALVVEDVALSDYARISEVLYQYSDFDIGFVDAAVLAITERLNQPTLATLDRRHFSVLRPRHVDTLRLVPDL